MPGTAPAGVTLRDTFSGKEDQQPDFGVPWLDFWARAYSPALRRWMVPDPLGEKHYGVNPYAYCNGDPVNYVDPEGREGIVISGHGTAGFAEFAYNQPDEERYSWSKEHVKQLNKGAFNNATIDLYTCNSATNTDNGTSLANALSVRTGSTVTGYRGYSTYRKMNKGQGWRAKLNRKRNGFNTKGSIRLPQAGKGGTRIKYIPPK